MFIISSCERMHFMVKKWKHFSIISMRFIHSIQIIPFEWWIIVKSDDFVMNSLALFRIEGRIMRWAIKKWYASDKLKHNLLYLYGSNIEIGKLLRCIWPSFYLSSSFKVTIKVWICDIKRIVLQITFSF